MSWASTAYQTFPIPVGSVLFFAGNAVPQNYLLADGASLAISDFPELFTVLGTDFGSVDANHFNLPDLITYPYMKGTNDFNPTPSASGTAVGLSDILDVTALPTLNNFSHPPVNSWGTADVVGGAEAHHIQQAPSGAINNIVKADSTFGFFGASYTGAVASISHTNPTPTPFDIDFGGVYFPNNLGLLPCICYTNSIPINPIINTTPSINPTTNNPLANVPNLSGFIFSQ